MPDRPKPARAPAPESRQDPSESEAVPEAAARKRRGANPQTDVVALAARFARYGRGNFTPEFSAELALDIVLNEIAEQACLATGATGSAIFLARNGEMFCRAGSGTVPALGARLEEGSRISQACVATRQIQRCDDARADPRADTEASRRLGLRSVIVLPLQRNGEMAGLLEAFSTRPSAFGERDQRTLEALARRVIQNLERAESPASPTPEPLPRTLSTPASAEEVYRSDDPFMKGNRLAEALSGEASGIGRGLEIVTWALGVLVLGCALMLGVLVIERLGWLRTEQQPGSSAAGFDAHRKDVHSQRPPAPSIAPDAKGDISDPRASPLVPGGEASQREKKNGADSGKSPVDALQPGALRVYKNGQEVFRVPPAAGAMVSGDTAGVERASSIEAADTVELSSAAAEDGLVSRVEPEYPDEARRQSIQGAVVLEVHIDRNGAVQEVKLVHGPQVLAEAAAAAVKQWKFRPRIANGHLVEMQTTITLNFKLPQ
jgi:TonB family protein